MKLLVCGGRNFDDVGTVKRVLAAVEVQRGPITLIITGAAPGADRLAQKWAERREIAVCVFPPNWALGRRAGPKRNAEMLKFGQPEFVVAFPGGRGTEDMVAKAKEAGLTVFEVRQDGGRTLTSGHFVDPQENRTPTPA